MKQQHHHLLTAKNPNTTHTKLQHKVLKRNKSLKRSTESHKTVQASFTHENLPILLFMIRKIDGGEKDWRQ